MNCLFYAAAAVFQINPFKLKEAFGADGTEILYPEKDEPWCRRGIHMQEIIEVALDCGIAVTEIQLRPVLEPDFEIIPCRMDANERFKLHLNKCLRAILLGDIIGSGLHHAIGLVKARCLDGEIKNLFYDVRQLGQELPEIPLDFAPLSLWRFDNIKSNQENFKILV